VLTDVVCRFLLVFLSIETILKEATIYRRREKLRAMKNSVDLGGAYEVMVERIKAEGGEKARLGMAVLMWISHSRRPLGVDEICHAIAIRIGSNDLHNDDTPTISTLLDCCQGLVTVDKGASTVRLIHFTLQEHLRTHPDLFDRAHATIAETCLTYLNFQTVKDLSTGKFHDLRDTPFLEYSSLYWGIHMRMEFSDRAKTMALELLCQFDSHISAKSLWKSVNGEPPFLYYGSEPFSALHCISYFGIPEVANTLIDMNRWDVNLRDSLGMTPLIWAARYGHEEVVGLLLRKNNIRPEQRDVVYFRTGLSWAAGNGHEGVVNLFLGPGFVNPGSIVRRWGSARRLAGLLFGRRYVNPDSLCSASQTPLSWAARNGHEGIVKLLLERNDVNPDIPDKLQGQTPLSWAARNGHEGIVKLLLERKEVDPDSSSKFGQTPLWRAAEKGHEGVVRLLLGREEVNPDAPDTEYGLRPLWRAAGRGHEGVVKLLLGRKDVNPDAPDPKYGQTPLSLAAENGHEGIVRLLLERKDVNPESSSKSGATPLWSAAATGHEGIVKLLLEREEVDPNNSNYYGQTPLWAAAENRHNRIVELLKARHLWRAP